jgi:hypothetical protein
VAAAMKLLEAAQTRFPNQAEILIRLAKQQSNQVFSAPTDAEKKRLAGLCLATAERAVAADPNSARGRGSPPASAGRRILPTVVGKIGLPACRRLLLCALFRRERRRSTALNQTARARVGVGGHRNTKEKSRVLRDGPPRIAAVADNQPEQPDT